METSAASPTNTQDDAKEIAARRVARRHVAVLPVAPALIIFGMLWVQYMFALRHPEVVARRPRTISSALNDPAIAVPFEIVLLIAAPFLLYSVIMLVRLYFHHVDRVFGGPVGPAPPLTRAFVWLSGLLQIVALTGMLLIAPFPSHTHSTEHLIASYMLFAGQATSILISGILGNRIANNSIPSEKGGFKGRFFFSLTVVALSLTFAFVYYLPTLMGTRPGYWMSMAITVFEILMISSFLFYMMSFRRDLLRYETQRRTGRI